MTENEIMKYFIPSGRMQQKVHRSTYKIFRPKEKKSVLNLINSIDISTNLKDTQSTEEQIKSHQRNVITQSVHTKIA